jgi:hypothetical protein
MLRCEGSDGEVLGSGLSGFPVVGEEFVEAAHGVSADALEDVAEIAERGDLMSFAGLDEAGQDGSGSPAVVAPKEQPLAVAQRAGSSFVPPQCLAGCVPRRCCRSPGFRPQSSAAGRPSSTTRMRWPAPRGFSAARWDVAVRDRP